MKNKKEMKSRHKHHKQRWQRYTLICHIVITVHHFACVENKISFSIKIVCRTHFFSKGQLICIRSKMIKLFSLKQQKKDGEQNKGTQKKSSAAQLRIQRGRNFRIVDEFMNLQKQMNIFVADINDLSLPKTCNTDFPDPDDLLTFKLILCPDEGKIQSNQNYSKKNHFFRFSISRFLQTRALRVQFQGKFIMTEWPTMKTTGKH